MIESTKAIFLSYASQDASAARAVGDALRAAGLEVWFDQSELRGGDAWDEMIRRQIAECALFIPIISATTASRLEGYFRLEWTLADQRTQRMARNKPFIIPVCVDNTPESSADVPESFVRVQWSRLPGGATPRTFVDRIAGLLGANITRAVTATPAAIDPAAASVMSAPNRSSGRGVWTAVGVSGVAILGVAAWMGLRTHSLSSPPPVPLAPATAPGVQSPSAGIPDKSIAVLPFLDMSEKKDQEYFSDGLSEELLDLLAQVPDLRVAARTSSFYFKGKAEDIAGIGQKLRVAHVLEGSVRKAGNKIRVTVQLIRADNGYHLWSKTYDRDVRDIFMVQDEISNAVVEALKIQLLSTRPLMSRHQTENMDAYSQYLLGNQLRLRDDALANGQARAAYQKAIALDPNYAAAYSGLSDAEWRIADQSTGESQGYARALVAAEKAMAIAPDAPEGYWARGQLRYVYYFDWDGARADFDKALALDPSFEAAGVASARLKATLGRFAEAVEGLRQLVARDPLSSRAWRRLGEQLLDDGQFAEIPAIVERLRAIGGGDSPELGLRGNLELFQGRPQQALQAYRQLSNPFWRSYGIAAAEYGMGQFADSKQTLTDLVHEFGNPEAFQYAMLCAWRNDKDEAFRWLDQAFKQHDGGLADLKVSRFLINIRSDPRYGELLDKMHLPR